MIKISNLTVSFKEDGADLTVLRNLSYSLEKAEVLAVVGESGCGKTIHALSLMRLLPPEARVNNGEIIFEQKDILKLPAGEVRKIRGEKIAMVFQDPMTSLNPVFTVEEQLAEAILAHKKISKAEALKKTGDLLEKVGIDRKFLKSYPHQLSGGMRQRVMIAMAMSCEPELLIADEPTTALDVTIQAQILELMEDIRAKKNTGILMITHDLGVVAEMCSRVVVMYAGRIVEEAPVQELFADPKHPYTQGLIGSVPKLGSGVESLPSIPGSVPDLSVMPKGCKFAPRCKYAMDICHQQEPELADINEAGTRKCRCHLLNKTGKEA